MITYLPVDLQLKDDYPFTCPCGHQQYARPSIAMRFDLNMGHGTCKKCNMFLHLEIVLPDNDAMKAEPHDAWSARLEASYR